jgi:Glycosyltransferase family 10 (fucosyltransferase) C-term
MSPRVGNRRGRPLQRFARLVSGWDDFGRRGTRRHRGADIEAQQNRKWTGNARTLRRNRFVLAMENKAVRGNITEKIVNAFLAGSIPIYYGTTEIFDVFNASSFVFSNVSDPRCDDRPVLFASRRRSRAGTMPSATASGSADPQS